MDDLKKRIGKCIIESDSIYEIATKLGVKPDAINQVAAEVKLADVLQKNNRYFRAQLIYKVKKGEPISHLCQLYNIDFVNGVITFLNREERFKRIVQDVPFVKQEVKEKEKEPWKNIIAMRQEIKVYKKEQEIKRLETETERSLMAEELKNRKSFKNKIFKKLSQPKFMHGVKQRALELLAEINDMEAVARMLNISVEDIETWKKNESRKIKKTVDGAAIAALYNAGASITEIKKRTGAMKGEIFNILRKECNYKTFFEQHGVIKYRDIAKQAKFDADRRQRIVTLFKEGWSRKELGNEFGLTSRVIERLLYKEGCIKELSFAMIHHKQKTSLKRNEELYADYKNGMSLEDIAAKYSLAISSCKTYLRKVKLLRGEGV